MNYHERIEQQLLDGTMAFNKPEDMREQNEVARQLEAAWGCTLHIFGALCQMDWYAIRDERLVAVVELKSRSHAIDHYPTVFLNVRKWHALLVGGMGLNVPAIYVVKFTDCIAWIPISEVDATKHRIAGCRHVKKSLSDREPVIDIPITDMERLA